jgi:outer membrane lipoprotein-sorting protein
MFYTLILAIFTCLPSLTVFAKPKATVDLKLVSITEQYLNSIKAISADFLQLSPDGEESRGKFFLSRPGKLKWQYEKPFPIIIIMSGKKLTHYDVELDQLSYTDAEEHIAGILTAKDVSFGKDIVPIRAYEEFSTIYIYLADKTKKHTEKLVLVLSKSPLELKQIYVMDTENNVTYVTFSNLQHLDNLDKSTFILQDPRIGFKNGSN